MSEEHLIPLSRRTKEEQKKIASKGGKKSGEVRRRKRDMKQKLRMILDLPASDNDLQQLELLGIPVEESDNEMVILKGLFLKAAEGDVSAIKEIRNILGKDNSSAELMLKKKELKLKEQIAEKNLPVTETETPSLYQALEADDDIS